MEDSKTMFMDTIDAVLDTLDQKKEAKLTEVFYRLKSDLQQQGELLSHHAELLLVSAPDDWHVSLKSFHDLADDGELADDHVLGILNVFYEHRVAQVLRQR